MPGPALGPVREKGRTMFCTQCGEKIADDAKFCTHCGAPVAAQAEASTEPDTAAGDEAADEKGEKGASEEPAEQEGAPETDGAADEAHDAADEASSAVEDVPTEKDDVTGADALEAGEEAASTADAEADVAASGEEAADGSDAEHDETADDDAPEDVSADDESAADEPAEPEAPAQGSLAAAAALIAATKQDQGVPEGMGTPKDGEAEWGSDKTTVIPGPKDGFAAKTADAAAGQAQAGAGSASVSAAQPGGQAAWQQAPAETQQWATAPAPAPQKRGHSAGFAVGMVLLAVAVAVVVGVGAMFALGMGPFARTGGAGGGQSTIIPVDVTVEVPDVLGMDEHDAMDELRDAGLAVGDVDEDYSSEYPEGTVCEQSPDGGDDADEGSEVDLVISKGPEVVVEHRYQMVTRAMSWADAQSWCEANGGYLATIDSAEEYQEVLNALSGSTTVCWLGGMRTGSSWEWVDGEPFSYTAWASGEPNNDGGNEDRLALLKVNGVWSWYDVPSDVRSVYPDYRLCFVMETEVEVPVD